jgi:hypothetical protein
VSEKGSGFVSAEAFAISASEKRVPPAWLVNSSDSSAGGINVSRLPSGATC